MDLDLTGFEEAGDAAAPEKATKQPKLDLSGFDESQPAGERSGILGMPREVAKGVAGGAVSALATAMYGAAVGSARDPEELAAFNERYADRVEKIGGMSRSDANALILEIKRDKSIRPSVADRIEDQILRRNNQGPGADVPEPMQVPTKRIQDTSAFQAGENVRQFGEEQFAPADDYRDTWTRTISEGLGSTAPFLAASIIPGVGVALSSSLGTAMGQGEAAQRAIDQGATESQIARAGGLGAVPGMTEQIPIEMLFERIPLPVAGMFGKVLGKVVSQAMAEGGQEAVQQVLQNVISKYVYNPDQAISEDVMENAIVGAAVGGIMGGAAGIMSGPDRPEEQAAPAQPTQPDGDQWQGAIPQGAAPSSILMPEEMETDAPGEAAPSGGLFADERAESPRLTEDDRKSPLPNSLIDDGKKIMDDLLGGKGGIDATSERPASGNDRLQSGYDADSQTANVPAQQDPTLFPAPETVSRPGREAQTLFEGNDGSVRDAGGGASAVPIGSDGASLSQGGTVQIVDANDLNVDAKTFQFKEGGDAEGVTDTLKTAEEWQPDFGGMLMAWQRRDGKLFVADGHQRSGLARRISAQTGQKIEIPVTVYREVDGFSAAEIRRRAALKNMAEGSGTAIDAAKVLRDGNPADLKALPKGKALIRDAMGIAKLSDEAYTMAINDVVNPTVAGVVGSMVAEKGIHAQMLSALKREGATGVSDTQSMVRDMLNAATANETQIDIFGEQETVRMLLKERAAVRAAAMNKLKGDKRVFTVLSKEEVRASEEGNILQTDANARRAQSDARLIEIIEKLSGRVGPIADAFNEAARAVAAGASPASASGRFIDSVRRTITEGVGRSDEASPGGRSDGRAPSQEVASTQSAPADLARPSAPSPADGDVASPAPESQPAAPEPQPAGTSRDKAEPRRTASWAVRRKSDNQVMFETFDKGKVDALNTEKYEAIPIGDYLASLNKPVKIEKPADMQAARDQVDTDPTEAQKEAGNYQKGHIQLHGFNITIENPKGAERRKVGPNGVEWSVIMPADYGYIKRTEGADGDHVDVYIGPNPREETVFVVEQKDAETGKFDEHKVMMGFDGKLQAKATYLRGFSDGKGSARLQSIEAMGLEDFRAWVMSDKPKNSTKPKIEKKATEEEQYSGLLQSALTGNRPVTLSDGRTYHVRPRSALNGEGGEGYIVLRMPQKPGEIPGRYRPAEGEAWTKEQAARKAFDIAKSGLNPKDWFEAEAAKRIESVQVVDGRPPADGKRHYYISSGEKNALYTLRSVKGLNNEYVMNLTGQVATSQEKARAHLAGIGIDKLYSQPPVLDERAKPASTGEGSTAQQDPAAPSDPQTMSDEDLKLGNADADSSREMETYITPRQADEPRFSMQAPADVTQTAEFKRWFGDSKVMRYGRPLLVYHGSPDARELNAPEGQFKTATERLLEQNDPDRAYFFTDDARTARTYADDSRAFDYQNAVAGTIGAYLSIKNPMVIDNGGSQYDGPQRQKELIAEAKANGHDGVIIKNTIDTYNVDGKRAANVYIAFSPEQIKTPDNRGTFDPADPRMRFSVRAERYNLGQGRQLAVLIRDRFDAETEAMTKVLSEELASLGMEKVGLRVVDEIMILLDGDSGPANGRYYKGLIEVAMNADDPTVTLRHEALHALRKAGAFTEQEWASLERRSREVWMKKHRIAEKYAFAPEATQIEEGIAHAFSEYQAGTRKELGVFAKLFERIAAILKALKKAFNKSGYQTPEDIFGAAYEGVMGRRVFGPPADHAGSYSIKSGDSDLFPTEIVETVDGPMEQMIVPGTQRISDKELAERRAAEKLKPKKAQRDVNSLPLFGDEKDQGSLFSLAQPIFYSEVARAADRISQNKAQPAQWLAMISKAPGVKPEEIEWLGLKEWLESQDGAVTKDQVQEFIRANQIEVRESRLSKEVPPKTQEEAGLEILALEALTDLDYLGFDTRGEAVRTVVADKDWRDKFDVTDKEAETIEAWATLRRSRIMKNTKYDRYNLPGGERYQELLLTLPASEGGTTYSGSIGPLRGDDADDILTDLSSEGLEELDYGRVETDAGEVIEFSGFALNDLQVLREAASRVGRVVDYRTDGAGGDIYRSSHWDEPNVLAHVRFSERKQGDVRALHIEEIQSDWHQAGRKKGYRLSPKERAKIEEQMLALEKEIYDQQADASPDQQSKWSQMKERLRADDGGVTVPDAPFKTSWPELTFKRMLRYAAENGFDRIVWTPGDVQAERYDLSKQIETLIYQKRGDQFELWAYPPGGATSAQSMGIHKAANLDNVVGKEIAKKITDGEGQQAGYYGIDAGKMALSGLDLKVGGEGMRGFYDKMLPKTIGKMIKKWGGKVEASEIGLNYQVIVDQNGKVVAEYESETAADNIASNMGPGVSVKQKGKQVWSVDITDAMREAALEGLPMFALQPSQRQAPVTAANQQRLLMGFISRRAPIDSAFRAVFMPLGGLDARGRFKPGVRATEYLGPEGSRGAAFGGAIGLAYGSALGGPVGAVAGGAVGATVGAAILSPKILPASRLGPIGHYIERVRAGVNDRYGLPDDYVRASRQQSLDERAIAAEGLEHLEAMKNAGIGTAEARVLYSMLTGDVVGHKDLEGLSEPIIRTIDQHGLEMVELGLISRESYERNRGQYLHRTYLKHEQKQNRFTKLVEFVTVGMAKKILGNELKGRGIFEDIALSKLMRGNEDFNNGRRGAPDLGEKFHRIAEVVPQTDALALDRKDKVLRRIYLDADKPIPDRYKGPSFLNEGVWEVRRKRGTEFTIWRDYTKEERQRMGEISDARYAIAKTYLLMAHDLASGRFFKAVAENEEWSRSNVAEGEWRNPSDIDNGQEWVRVPDTIIQNTGGVPKYGAMAGRFVRSAIWRDLTELDRMHNPNSWRSLLTMWKLNKTARNPVVHMNNVVSNLVLADMADVTAVDLVDGIQSWLKKDQYYLDAQHHGAMGVDMISAEIRANHINPLLEEIVSAGPGNNGWMARSKIIGTMAKVWDGIVKLDGKMQDAYKAEDDIFRMAYYRKLIREGMDPFIAADMTREQFIDYDIRAPWVNSLRYSVMPFIGYTYRAVPLVANTMMERPWKLAKYATIAYMINALAYWADDEADEDQERASFRDEEQGYTWLGTQRLWRLPFRDDAERPMFIDTRRWIPAGDVFDIGQGSSAVPIPAPFMFGGPMMLAAELLLLNKSAFTGEEITGEYDTTLEKFSKSGGYALKSFIPSAPWIPGSWYWEKIKNAMTGAVDYSGNDYSVPLAVLNSVGIKARWQDVEQGLYWNGFEFNKEATELRRQARSLARKRQRNLISQSDFESAQAVLVLKMERVKERYGEFKEKADK